MHKLRLVLLIALCFVVILTTTCTPQATPSAEPSPSGGLQSLPQDLPTLTLQPTLTPLPTKIFLTPTSLFNPTATPVPALYTAVPTPGTAAPTQPGTLEILLYEDTGDIGLWVKEALDAAGRPYNYVSGSGNLQKQLETDTKWSLIIIAAENRSSIQGDLWDLISQKVTEDNSALIAELWFIDLIYEGKIKPFLNTCGVELSKHYNLPLAVPVYFIEPTHPIFNSPNPGLSLLKPAPFWDDQAVDYLKLLPDSPAKILAAGVEGDKADNGLIVSCYDGRVILQTFLNHDYPEATIKALWQNYMAFVLQQRNK